MLRQTGPYFVYKIDGQLRQSKTTDIREIAWMLMFADDIALITESEEEMLRAIELTDVTFTYWGLDMSLKKTKVMPLLVSASTQHVSQHITIGRGGLEYVEQFKYLGSISSAGLSMQPEMSHRLARAGNAFHKLSRLWGDKHLAQSVKCSVYKTIVQATLLYGCETWAVPAAHISPLDTFQMRCLRRICRISLRQRRTNYDILESCTMESIRTLVAYRRLRWLGHLARMPNERLPKQLLFATLGQNENTQPSVGRPIKPWSDYVREDLSKLGLLYHWYRAAQDRETWRSTISKLLEHT